MQIAKDFGWNQLWRRKGGFASTQCAKETAFQAGDTGTNTPTLILQKIALGDVRLKEKKQWPMKTRSVLYSKRWEPAVLGDEIGRQGSDFGEPGI